MPRTIIPLITRLMSKVDMLPDLPGCWIFAGALDGDGYGCIGVKRVVGKGMAIKLAHRVSYELHRGPISDGTELDHLCRLRCCVNPWHLEPVPHIINVLRGSRVGTESPSHNRIKTHCPHGHEYTPENTYISKDGRHRDCRECHLAKSKQQQVNKAFLLFWG